MKRVRGLSRDKTGGLATMATAGAITALYAASWISSKVIVYDGDDGGGASDPLSRGDESPAPFSLPRAGRLLLKGNHIVLCLMIIIGADSNTCSCLVRIVSVLSVKCSLQSRHF